MTRRLLLPTFVFLAAGCGPAGPQGKTPPVILGAALEAAGPPAWVQRVELARKRDLLDADLVEISRRLLAVDEEIEVLRRDLRKTDLPVRDLPDPIEKTEPEKTEPEKAVEKTEPAKAVEPSPAPAPVKDEVVERLTAETANLAWKRDRLAQRYLERRRLMLALRRLIAEAPR